jgi:hypothetical protein
MSSHDKAVVIVTLIATIPVFITGLSATIGGYLYYGKRKKEAHELQMLREKRYMQNDQLKQLATEERVLDKKLELGKKADK